MKNISEKKKNWFRRHWIISIILGFFLFSIVIGAIQDIGNTAKYSDYSQNGLVVVNSDLLLPQDSEIDRIWKVGDIKSLSSNSTGFVEGAEREISKFENFESSSVTADVYRFDSLANAQAFYNQEKQGIDVRGVEEWSLGNSCFGIKKDVILSGYAKGFCLRNNVVFYIESVSHSTSYTKDGKDFMNIMLKKV